MKKMLLIKRSINSDYRKIVFQIAVHFPLDLNYQAFKKKNKKQMPIMFQNIKIF